MYNKINKKENIFTYFFSYIYVFIIHNTVIM